jgi:hypothetical protein
MKVVLATAETCPKMNWLCQNLESLNVYRVYCGESLDKYLSWTISHSVIQSVGQSASRSVGQSFSRSVGQSASRPVGQSVIYLFSVHINDNSLDWNGIYDTRRHNFLFHIPS